MLGRKGSNQSHKLVVAAICSIVGHLSRSQHDPTFCASAFVPPTPVSRPRPKSFLHTSELSSSSSSSDMSRSGKIAAGLGTTSTSGENLQNAKNRIEQAISIGAPAYNAGHIKKCADVYEETAKDIVSGLPESLQKNLRQCLDDVATSSGTSVNSNDDGNDDDAKAWAFRRQFDAIVGYQPPFAPATNSLEDITLESFTPQQLSSQPIAVMDGVMGGVSSGKWISDTQTFVGTTSLANNGGFASLRWRFETVQNWSYAKGLFLKVRHSKPSEHTFRVILKDATCERVRLSNFKAVFANPEGSEEDGAASPPILIPFSEMGSMEQMGREMAGAPNFQPSTVTEIGIMAIKPSVVGDFQITIDDWGLYV